MPQQPPRPILRVSTSALDVECWRSYSDDASTSGSDTPYDEAPERAGPRRCSTPGGLRRTLSWNDHAGGELEAVRSIERRPKRPSFLAASFTIIKDEFLYSFGRGNLASQSGLVDGPPCSDGAATACADSAAEAALFEARANALHNVERVRDWPPRDAGALPARD